ncbi:MAG: hypothetical protein HQM10_20995 [Candidatus Riflebacteria bacterium]|nr:hypothetical protein [Candidatus Riflebacteria bacterium]
MKRKAFGLIEAVLAAVCFIVAAIPITSLFSFNIENSKVIHLKVLSYTAAIELVNQVSMIELKKLSDGKFDIGANEISYPLGSDSGSPKLLMSKLPEGFSRILSIEKIDENSVKIIASLKVTDQPRANIEIYRILCSGRGGKL